jgi:CheY-like chemotaxis protein/DNA-binding MarR family transcriptional regulator
VTPSPAASGNPAVLVVDDDAESATELEAVVQAAGFRTRLAHDGSEALRILREAPDVGIIISDVRMPKMDGLTFIAEFRRQLGDRARAQIIFVSGNAGLSDALAALRLEAIEFLLKPISRTAMFEALKKAAHAFKNSTLGETHAAAMKRQAELVASHAVRLANDFASLVGSAAPGRPPLFVPKAAPATGGAAEALPTAPPRAPTESPVDESAAEYLRRRLKTLIKLRQLRASFFSGELFSDPCWDMLLDLMEAQLTAKQVSVSSLCIAAGVPQTTALRRIEDLAEAGLVARLDDPNDKRRVFVQLTPDCARRFTRYLDEISTAF